MSDAPLPHLDRARTLSHPVSTCVAWVLWLALLVAAVGFVLRFGFSLPYADEMELVPQALGEQPVTAGWLWSQHNEHRILLPRLLYLALLRVTGSELRAMALYNTAVLAGAAALLMLAARKVRGRTCWWDAFFPAVLLHWSHAINLLWVFQSAFATTVALTCALLWLVITCGPELSIRRAIVVSCCLVLMGLCGANGIAHLPSMCGWLCVAAAARWRHARGAAVAVLLLAAIPAGILGGYFVDFHRPLLDEVIAPTGPARASAMLQMLAVCLGSVAREIWPASGIVALLVVGACVFGLIRSWRDQQDQRLSNLGLGCLLCGQLALAVGIGWGRAALGSEAALTGRYILLAAPLACLAYLIAISRAAHIGHFTLSQRRLAVALGALVCVVWAINMRKGWRDALDLDCKFSAVTADIRQGLDPESLARRHGFLYPMESVLAVRLEALRRARFGAFADVAPAGELRAVSVVTLAALQGEVDTTGALHFLLPAGHQLCRIDIPLHSRRRGRDGSSLHWTLSRREPGASTILRQGEIDFEVARQQRFLCLQFERVSGGDAFELTLSPTGNPDSAGGAFLYVQPPANLAQAAETMHR